ncbi:hypothetical protein RIF29_22346 [Crotalaria pallida]|uniref:Uncharacterized protein n=1 Tax=Crotalaria pallida TaxID=3830 RepID=A0AAN9FD70_CROPI
MSRCQIVFCGSIETQESYTCGRKIDRLTYESTRENHKCNLVFFLIISIPKSPNTCSVKRLPLQFSCAYILMDFGSAQTFHQVLEPLSVAATISKFVVLVSAVRSTWICGSAKLPAVQLL